jgi:hypothetical protein
MGFNCGTYDITGIGFGRNWAARKVKVFSRCPFPIMTGFSELVSARFSLYVSRSRGLVVLS